MLALLIIDVQNDFCPGGRLGVSQGDAIIPLINGISPYFECTVLTQDWHPENHSSFAANHSNKKEYETIEMDYGTQVLWPKHCMQGSMGADFHPELNTLSASMIIRKGFRPTIDSYSAFFENDKTTSTGLKGYLENLGVTTVFLAGIATDFCVKWSALDAIESGFKTYVIEDAVKGIDLDNSVELAINEMKQAGVEFIQSDALLRLLQS